MSRTPLLGVTQWAKSAEKWSLRTGTPTALILATIHQESRGLPMATRYEPAYQEKYVNNNDKNKRIARECGLTLDEVATSYGLMQLMFPLAYGYGARSKEMLFDADQNIRLGAAHLSSLIKKCRFPITDTTCIRVVAGNYNGAGSNSSYARSVGGLYLMYEEWLNGQSF